MNPPHALEKIRMISRTAPVSLPVAILALLTGNASMAQQAPQTADAAREILDEVTIFAHRREPADIPGSAQVIGHEQLEVFLQSDVMRVLRRVPGVYLQEEDGFGLRPNIGIRGSGLDRSARVALLEDGVLIAPAPYAAPSAYYFPTQRRMYALEVLKGPASIAVGPKTTGGAINLISTPIPRDFSAYADLRAGHNDAFDVHAHIGDRGPRFAWLVETVQTQSDGLKPSTARPAPTWVRPASISKTTWSSCKSIRIRRRRSTRACVSKAVTRTRYRTRPISA